VQDLVIRHRGDHQRNRHGFEQVALRFRRPRLRGEFLLDAAAAVELVQHVVESGDQATDLVRRVPRRAQGVVAGSAHAVGHLGEAAKRQAIWRATK
jgi:hypothetical protein